MSEKKILLVQTSPMKDHSYSRKVMAQLEKRIISQNPGSRTTIRDLDSTPVPHLNAATLAAFHGAGEADGLTLSDELINEVMSNDIIVIAAPMWNFGVPSVLKAWVDHISRAGKTFSYSENGPVGLIKNTKAIVVASSGGIYSEGAMKSYDFVTSYLRSVLSFLGITDIQVVHVEGTAMPNMAEPALSKAFDQVENLYI